MESKGKEEWQAYLREVIRELEPPSERHLDSDEIIAYVQARMAENKSDVQASMAENKSAPRAHSVPSVPARMAQSDSERAQAHLVQCADCIEKFRDAYAFFATEPAGSQSPGDLQIRRDWDALWRQVRLEERRDAIQPGWSPASLFRNPRFAWAVAASLIVVFGLTSLRAWSLRQESQELARRAQAEHDELEKRVVKLEQEKRDRDQALANYETQKRASETQIAELKKPQVNTQIFDVYPQSFIQKSGGQTHHTSLAVTGGPQSFVLRLVLENQEKYQSYKIKIFDQKNQLMHSKGGVKLDHSGSFAITLHQDSVSKGKYLVKLYGQRGNQWSQIEEYRFSLR